MNRLIVFIILIYNSFGVDCLCQQEYFNQKNDWLINGEQYISKVSPSTGEKELTISNGLVERNFRITPNFATTAVTNLQSGHSFLRSVRPEAQITVNGLKFDIGGLLGQPVHNYLLKRWVEDLTNDAGSFQFVRYTVESIKPRFDWKKRGEWISGKSKWPPDGKELIAEFQAPDQVGQSMLKGLVVKVHYEIYDGLPLICKWITIHNNTGEKIVLNHFISEILAAVEAESSVEGESDWQLPNMHVETDYAFSSMSNRVEIALNRSEDQQEQSEKLMCIR